MFFAQQATYNRLCAGKSHPDVASVAGEYFV